MESTSTETSSLNFIEQIIEDDLKAGNKRGEVYTRFPPEPNGYLHIGHAKAICLNFGLSSKYKGKCNLRFDDTNPEKENIEYVESIQKDIQWLGFEWAELRHASDYFEQLFEFAVRLINAGKAYVDELNAEEVSAYRGHPTSPGKESPWRNRSVEENLDLFQRMRAGEFPDDKYTLRAKIDMNSPNMHMRDPIMYRIRHVHHYRTGDAWPIYPMYDFAHGTSDAIETITHSICTLEFEVHRPLYEWFNDNIFVERKDLPQQIEMARLNLSYTVMSKRKLLQLVEGNLVSGWDDPRMPTLSAYRRRGYTAASIRNFCETVGVAKRNHVIDLALLEFHVREDLNKVASRVLAVLNPLKVVITNYPEGQTEEFDAVNNPEDPEGGTRKVPFGKELFIEREDFMEDPPRKFFRLGPGREVRLKYAYYITCNEVIKNDAGEIVELRCTYDPESRGGGTPDNRKVKGTLHWVSAEHAVDAKVRLYDRLFSDENPDGHPDKDFKTFLNPDSLKEITAKVEPGLKNAEAGQNLQFERLGYFIADSVDHSSEHPTFNRTVTLRDSWAKKANKKG